jgi:hypothetical protein
LKFYEKGAIKMLNVYLRHSKVESRYVIEVSDCGINAVRDDAWMEHEQFVVWTSCGFYVCERSQRCSKPPLAFEVQSFDSLCSALRRGTSKFYVPDGGEYVEYKAQKVLVSPRLFNLTSAHLTYGDLVLPSGVTKYESGGEAVGDSVVIAVLFRGGLYSCEYVEKPVDLSRVMHELAYACNSATVGEDGYWSFRDLVTGNEIYCLVRMVAL